MSPLSPRYVALPAAALAIIVGLAQAHSQAHSQGTGQTGTPETAVHQVTSCTASANTLMAGCALADVAGANVIR
jgi:hypothetical protein